MATTTWKQLVYDFASAVKYLEGGGEKIEVGQLASKITSINRVGNITITPKISSQNIPNNTYIYGSGITIDPYPEYMAEAYSYRHWLLLSTGKTSYNNLNINIAGITYCDGTYLAIGYDGSNNIYKLYKTDPSNTWTSVKFISGNSRPYNPSSITCDGTTVWISNTSAYEDRHTLLQSLSDFKSTTTSLSYYAKSNVKFYDSVSYNGQIWIVGGIDDGTTYSAASLMNIEAGSTSTKNITHGSINGNNMKETFLRKCCMYNTYPMAITFNGTYTYKNNISTHSVNGIFTIADNFMSTACAQLGEYFAVAGTHDDGTYIYYAKGDPGSFKFDRVKISSEKFSNMKLAYVSNFYILAYVDAVSPGMEGANTRFWASEDIATKRGISGLQPQISDGFIVNRMIAVDTDLLLAGSLNSKTYSLYIDLRDRLTFTIDGKSYYADDGMTWEDWVLSNYNTAGLRSDEENDWIVQTEMEAVCDSYSSPVSPRDTILANTEYTIIGQ